MQNRRKESIVIGRMEHVEAERDKYRAYVAQRGAELRAQKQATEAASPPPSDNLMPALHWADMGVRVLPVNSDKTPATAHGYHDAATDHDTIYDWFDGRADLQVGLVTGDPIIVVDCDGQEAIKTWSELLQADSTPESPFVLRTPHGEHHYYRSTEAIPRAIRLFSLEDGGGIDILGKGGYTIVAGEGRGWKSLPPPTINELPELPGIVRDQLASRLASQVKPLVLPAGYKMPTLEDGRLFTAWGAAVYNRCLDEITRAKPGGRHTILLHRAHVMGGVIASGHVQLSTETVIRDLAHASIQSGHDEIDAWRTARDGVEMGLSAPRVPKERKENIQVKETTMSETPTSVPDPITKPRPATGYWDEKRGIHVFTFRDQPPPQDTNPTSEAQTSPPSIHWAKLETGWALSVPAGTVEVGQTIAVAKKDGTTQEVTIQGLSKEWEAKDGTRRVFAYPVRDIEAERQEQAPSPAPAVETPSVRWTKTKSGYWALQGPADQLTPGTEVTITKKDGTSQTVKVASNGTPWIDEATGVEMVRAIPVHDLEANAEMDAKAALAMANGVPTDSETFALSTIDTDPEKAIRQVEFDEPIPDTATVVDGVVVAYNFHSDISDEIEPEHQSEPELEPVIE
jgi:hypothetical protein